MHISFAVSGQDYSVGETCYTTAVQLGLFTEPVDEAAAALAAGLPPNLRFGTMSWNYPGWIGLVYPGGRKAKQLLHEGFSDYVRYPLFRTVEFDRTYYQTFTAASYAEYAERAPDDFRFVAKAHEDCTQVLFPKLPRYGQRAGMRNTRLLDAAYARDHVVAPFVEGLGHKGAVLLFQFSPMEVRSPQKFAEKLHAFLQKLPQSVTYAVEVRNRELLTPAYGQALIDVGALHCYNVWNRMPSIVEQAKILPAATRKQLLVRWLNQISYEAAEEKFAPFNQLLEPDVKSRKMIVELSRVSDSSLVLVNNQAEGCAPKSILKLAEEFVTQDRTNSNDATMRSV